MTLVRWVWSFGIALALLCGAAFRVEGGTIPPEATDPAEQLNGYATLDERYLPAVTTGTGEQVDLYTGTLGFSVTDVDLPGTGELAVRFTRTFSVGTPGNGPENLPLADWEIAVPVITGTVSGGVHGVDTGWRVHSTTPFARCSLFGSGPPPIETEWAEFTPLDYWNGFHLHVPGAGSQTLLSRASANDHVPTMTIPGTSGTWPVVTRNDWMATCLPSLSNGEPGEGFLVVAPDGRKFWFDHLAYRGAAKLMKPNEQARGDDIDTIPQFATLHRWKAMLFATRVEDRHGNWVEYTYGGSKLARIEASDGRVIDVDYSGGWVEKVTAQPLSGAPREWTYDYIPGDNQFENPTLSHVHLPEDGQWDYDLENLSKAWMEFQGGYCVSGGAISPTAGQGSLDSLDGSVTTPGGLHVAYHLDVVERGHSYTPLQQCISPTTPLNPSAYYVFALDHKIATGPGLPQRTWQYDRSPANDSWVDCGTGCPDEVWTSVTTPEHHTTVYTFSNRFDATEGQLLEIDPEGPRLETRFYAASDQGPWPDRYGYGNSLRSNYLKQSTQTPLQSRVISEGSSYQYTVSAFDGHARPTVITRHATGSGGDSISETLAYTDKPAFWVLGTLTSRMVTAPAEHVGDVPFSQTLYANGQPQLVSRFGRTVATYEWYPSGHAAAGELKKVTDARNHATEYSDYERGVPKTIDYADSTDISLTVNDFGEVLSVTDEDNDTVTVQRDDMGRIKRRIFPVDSGQSWNDEVISYEIVPTDEYNVDAGHFRVTRQNGNHRRVTVYDAAMNPVLSKETDSATGDGHMAWRQFDSAGRETFTSYPLDYAASLPGGACQNTILCPGVESEYDALGRVTDRYANSELGLLHTGTAYLSGNMIAVTNPRNHTTTTTYQAFDQPSHDNALKVIFADAGTTEVTIVRDVYGKPETMTQTGEYSGHPQRSVSHSFHYDAYQQLCLQVSPETGRTGYGYYANGLLEWSVQGLPAQSAPCSASFMPPAATTVYRSYDVRDRLTDILYPGTTPDTSFGYDDDGKLDVATRGGSSWNLEWLNRGLLDKETLNASGAPHSQYVIDYGYNSRGQRDTLQYPSGLQISLDPDAMGRPRQLGVYASAIDYDAWGAPEAFSYGNGMAFAQSRNIRGLIASTSYSLGGYALVDRTLGYDKNGNLLDIFGAGISAGPADRVFADGFEPLAAGSFHRQFQYDSLDRLTNATSSQYGSETFRYDPLGNIRQSDFAVSAQARAEGWFAPDPSRPLASAVLGTTHFDYDPATNRLTSAGGNTWHHDTRGNVDFIVTPGGTRDFTYNRANELVEDLAGTSFAYDARSWRYHQQTATHDRFFVYDHTGKLIERIDNGTRTDFVYLGAMPVARIEGSTASYLHPDYQSSPIFETDASGSINRKPVYLAYGFTATTGSYNGTDEAPGYAGAYPEASWGANYMGARYQFGPIARFLSPDPAPLNPLHPVGLNRYAYANNSPARYTDPFGLQSEDNQESDMPCNAACMRMRRLSERFSGVISRETAQQRYDIAVRYKEKAIGGLTGRAYISPILAASAFSEVFATASGVLALEFGANITASLNGTYYLEGFVISSAFTMDGVGARITPLSGSSPTIWGFIHTHPGNSPRGFSFPDIQYLTNRNISGFVISPDGTIQSFLHSQYIRQNMPSADYIYYHQGQFGGVQ